MARTKDRAKASLVTKVEAEGVRISALAGDGGRLKPAPRDAVHSQTDAAGAASTLGLSAADVRVLYERLGLSASTLACRLELAGLA